MTPDEHTAFRARCLALHERSLSDPLMQIMMDDEETMMTDDDQNPETDANGNPLATTVGADPGNTDPEELTAPLDPNDDVYTVLGGQANQ